MFQYKNNLLTFYLFTNISKASNLVDSYLKDQNSPFFRYFVFQGIAIKILNEEYIKSKELIDICQASDLTSVYEGYLQNNYAILKLQVIESVNRGKVRFNIKVKFYFRIRSFLININLRLNVISLRTLTTKVS